MAFRMSIFGDQKLVRQCIPLELWASVLDFSAAKPTGRTSSSEQQSHAVAPKPGCGNVEFAVLVHVAHG